MIEGHKRRFYTDEQLAEFVRRPVPYWANVRQQIADRRASTSFSASRLERLVRDASAQMLGGYL